MTHAKHCQYCYEPITERRPATVDHVVPRWVSRLFWRQLAAAHPNQWHQLNRVTACHSCNRRKGSMPVAIFLSIHLQKNHLLKLERSRWDRIAAEMAEVRVPVAMAHPRAQLIMQSARHRSPSATSWARSWSIGCAVDDPLASQPRSGVWSANAKAPVGSRGLCPRM